MGFPLFKYLKIREQQRIIIRPVSGRGLVLVLEDLNSGAIRILVKMVSIFYPFHMPK